MSEQIAQITDRMIQLALGLTELRQTVETIIEAGGGRDSFERYEQYRRGRLAAPAAQVRRWTRFKRWFGENVYSGESS